MYNSFIMQNKKQTLLYDWEVIKSFLPYLSMSDLLKSALISKTWSYHLNQYIKKFFIPEQYIHIHSNPIKALKILYNRKIFIIQNMHTKAIKLPYLIEKISVGNIVTALKTLTGQNYLVSNHDLEVLNRNELLVSPNFKKLNHKYEQIKCVGDYVYCIKDSDIVQYKPNVQNILAEESEINLEGTIDHFISSFAYCFVCCGELTKESQYFIFAHNNPKPIKIQLKVPINNVAKQIILGHGSNAFIVSEGNVLEGNLEAESLKLTQMRMLKGKKIWQIKSGKGHFFAFEAKNTPIKDWTNMDVIKWAQESGFVDYVKIFKIQNVTGKKLLDMSRLYMEDSLGIKNNKVQQKMKLLLEQWDSMLLSPDNFNVYAWGRNDKCQLGTNPSSVCNNIFKPKFPQDFHIWDCIGDFTILKHKNTETYMINRVIENKLKWEQISQSHIWSLGLAKGNKLIFCSSISKEKSVQRLTEHPIEQEKKKMKTAKNIIDKINWSENLKIEQFNVGYMDRYEGMLETNLQDFLRGDAKDYWIYYFKQNGKIVWDRNSKLDIL